MGGSEVISPFSLHQPDAVEKASAVLARHGGDARVLAGGSQLVLLLKSGSARPRHLVDVKRIARMSGVHFSARTETLTVGSLVTYRALEASPIVRERFPLLVEMARRIGNIRVRNVGTLGGNLCLAEPNSDPPTLLMAYKARLTLGSSRGERELDMEDFLVSSNRTALGNDELLLDIRVPAPAENCFGVYLRFCPLERPTVSVALTMEWKGRRSGEVRLVLGCVCPKPLRLFEIEERLSNQSVDQILGQAAEAGQRAALVCNPSDDSWTSARYKTHLAAIFVSRAISRVCEKLPYG